jgi:ketosteroid isomerase-like protein
MEAGARRGEGLRGEKEQGEEEGELCHARILAARADVVNDGAIDSTGADAWETDVNRICIVALLVAALAGPAIAQGGSPAAERAAIRKLRLANNAAIAAHDLDGVMAMVAEDFVLTGGNSGIQRSAAANRAAWTSEFGRAGFDRYVRTPERIEVGRAQGVYRAAETGHWAGIDHTPKGDVRRSGRYFAHWSMASGGWRAVAETYVTLRCDGAGC